MDENQKVVADFPARQQRSTLTSCTASRSHHHILQLDDSVDNEMTYPYPGHQYPYDPRWPPQQSQQPHTAPIYLQEVCSYPQHYHPRQSVPFPTNPPPPRQYAPQYYATPPRHPPHQARIDRGRDYLASLTTSVSNLELGNQAGPSRLSSVDKPLPRLPPPPIPARPCSFPSYTNQIPPLPTPPRVPPDSRLYTNSPTPQQASPARLPQPSTPPRKSFTPSFHPLDSTSQGDLLRPPDVHRPHSEPVILTNAKFRKKGKGKEEVLDLTLDSSDDESWDSLAKNTVHTKNSSPRHRKAISELPRTPLKPKSPIKPPASPASPSAVRCSGYTRAGQPCKRVVKSTAPFLTRDQNLDDTPELGKEERYCKDHAGMICQVGGFYWRGSGQNVWINFEGKLIFSQ